LLAEARTAMVKRPAATNLIFDVFIVAPSSYLIYEPIVTN